MESFFGADEDADEAALDEAQSLAEVLKLQKQDSQESVPTIMKETADEEIIVDDNDRVKWPQYVRPHPLLAAEKHSQKRKR